MSYKNEGEAVKIHYGARLNALAQFTDYVSSALSKECGSFDGDFFVVGRAEEKSKSSFGELCFQYSQEKDNKESVIYIAPYVGVDYISYNDYFASKGNTIIVHDSYHSGTVKTDGANNINCLKQKVYLVGGLKTNEKYESALNLNSNIEVYDNITAAALYLKLILSRNMSEKERALYLKSNTAYEYF